MNSKKFWQVEVSHDGKGWVKIPKLVPAEGENVESDKLGAIIAPKYTFWVIRPVWKYEIE